MTAEVNVGSGSGSITVPPSPARGGGAQFGFSLSNTNVDSHMPSSETRREDRFETGRNEAESVARILTLETQMHELKNQMLANAVTVGGTLFKSRVDVKSW